MSHQIAVSSTFTITCGGVVVIMVRFLLEVDLTRSLISIKIQNYGCAFILSMRKGRANFVTKNYLKYKQLKFQIVRLAIGNSTAENNMPTIYATDLNSKINRLVVGMRTVGAH